MRKSLREFLKEILKEMFMLMERESLSNFLKEIPEGNHLCLCGVGGGAKGNSLRKPVHLWKGLKERKCLTDFISLREFLSSS